MRTILRKDGFTLLELVVAVALLAGFILPLLLLLTESKTRAANYTRLRQVRDLAQRKLHERINYWVEEDEGTFEEEGHPRWLWRVLPPQRRGQSDQVLLEYTIEVEVPFPLDGTSSTQDAGEFGSEYSEGSVYTYSVWTFPSSRWYEEQELLYEAGQATLLYGNYDANGLPLTGGNY